MLWKVEHIEGAAGISDKTTWWRIVKAETPEAAIRGSVADLDGYEFDGDKTFSAGSRSYSDCYLATGYASLEGIRETLRRAACSTSEADEILQDFISRLWNLGVEAGESNDGREGNGSDAP